MKNDKIVVIEDEAAIRRVIVLALKTAGYRNVLEADNGLTGCDLVERERPQLVLLDLMLPGMDGMEVCRRLRMDKRTAHEIVTLVQWHDRDIPRTEKAIARAVHQLGEDTFRRLLAIKRADNLAQHPDYRGRLTEIDRAEAILDGLLAKQACFSLRDLAVNGGDLLALGLRGPAVGHTLNALLEQVLDGTLPNEREALLDAVRRLL